MKRQVSIFIETNPLQLDNDFTRLELFNDEKISVTSTIQNISDIGKIFTDFSQGFTIPCSPINNGIFQHFYQNDVDASIKYQKRFNAFIEINTTLFRRGKIQFEKANLKNGKPDSYSVTFYGAGVSLKDHFLDDKLSQLNYSTLNHNYTNNEVYNRVTIDSTINDYNVRYPLISSKRVWQYSTTVPSTNPPTWYTPSNANNLQHISGALVYTELFPAVRVASIFNLIASEYGITFNGIFLLTDFFKKAFLLYKNKDVATVITNAANVNLTASSGALAIAFNTTNNTFQALNTNNYDTYQHLIGFNVTAISNPTTYYFDVYTNGVFTQSFTGTTTSSNVNQFNLTVTDVSLITFKMRSVGSTTLTLNFTYTRTYYDSVTSFLVVETGLSNNATVSTTGFTDLSSLAPDLKISDFITGICKEFNLTVYSNTKNVYTFDPIPFWYSKGIIINVTKYTDIASIEIERVKLYKAIEFKYQDSECFMNKAFLESPTNPDAHGYGNIKAGYDYDGGEYKIESPFENLLHTNFGNQLQVGYCLNKEFAPYVPKPVLLYMNKLTTLTGSNHFHWNGQGTVTSYMPFGQDAQVLTTTGLAPISLNFSADISSYFNVPNLNSLYALYYQGYLSNLYNPKNRLTKVKVILPVRLLTTLKLNDRLIISDKRYIINEMQSDLTTGEVNFTLLNDFREIQSAIIINLPV